MLKPLLDRKCRFLGITIISTKNINLMLASEIFLITWLVIGFVLDWQSILKKRIWIGLTIQKNQIDQHPGYNIIQIMHVQNKICTLRIMDLDLKENRCKRNILAFIRAILFHSCYSYDNSIWKAGETIEFKDTMNFDGDVSTENFGKCAKNFTFSR